MGLSLRDYSSVLGGEGGERRISTAHQAGKEATKQNMKASFPSAFQGTEYG